MTRIALVWRYVSVTFLFLDVSRWRRRSVIRFIIELHPSFYGIKHLVCPFYRNPSMDCYYRLQFHRRFLERQMPMVPKLSMPVCDVRDVAAAHITAMTSPKAPGMSVKQFFLRINKWLLSRHLDVLMPLPWIINFPMLTLQTRIACGFSIICHLGDLWGHCGGLGIEILMPYPIN